MGYVVDTHRIEASIRGNEGPSRGNDVSPCGNEVSPRGNDVGKGHDDVFGVRNEVYTAGNVVNAAADDVSADRSADGARRHLSESRCRVGQRCLPGGANAVPLPCGCCNAAREWPPQLALRRSTVCVLDPIRSLRVPGALYGTTSGPGRQAQICGAFRRSPLLRCRAMTHYRPFNIVTTRLYE
jgi:hypothetical protein